MAKKQKPAVLTTGDAEDRPLYQRDSLLHDLRNNVIEVQFTKTNGEDRLMRCTLMPRLLPESYRINEEEQTNERKFHRTNADTIAAWDVVKGGWRSFRIDSVIYAQALDSY